MRLTVVVPVYNVETTLVRCLDSILSQNVEDLELILVNDGSTDTSAEIAAGYAERYPCVALISQTNAGLSAARNTGIDAATGDFVTFVDSDDYIRPTTFTVLLALLDDHPEVDILEYSVLTESNVAERTHILQDKVYPSARRYWMESQAYSHTYACNKLFRTSLFRDGEPLRFPVGKVFEDIHLLPLLLQREPTVMTTSLGYYFYSWNPAGITAKAGGEQLRQLLDAQLSAAAAMQMEFMDDDCREVPYDEVPFYTHILNNQIVVSRLTGEPPRLPSRKVPLYSVEGFAMKTKVLCLNILGMKMLCKLGRKSYRQE